MSLWGRESNPGRLNPIESSGEDNTVWKVLLLEAGGCCFWNLNCKIHSVYYEGRHKYLKEVLGGCTRYSISSSSMALNTYFMLTIPNVISLALTLPLKSRHISNCQVTSPLGCLSNRLRLNISKIQLLVFPLSEESLTVSSSSALTPPSIQSII